MEHRGDNILPKESHISAVRRRENKSPTRADGTCKISGMALRTYDRPSCGTPEEKKASATRPKVVM